jgi:hypothetical protein
LDVLLFKNCVEKIMARHWVLHTKFQKDGENVYQVIAPPEIPYFFERDLRDTPEDILEETLINTVRENSGDLIDVTKSPLFRCYLTRIYDEQYFFVVKGHHIIWDGLSLDIFRKELKELYTAHLEKRTPKLSELPLQYVDFARWERDLWISEKPMAERVKYWKGYLSDLPIMTLPPSSSQIKEDEGGFIFRVVDPAVMEKVTKFSRENNVTLYVSIVAAFCQFVSDLTSQKDIVFNTVFSQRPAEIENIMGYFMAIVPLWIKLGNSLVVADLVKQVRERSFLSQSNLVPSHKIWEIASEKDRNAVANIGIMFNYTTGFRDTLDLPGIVAENLEFEGGGAPMQGMFVQFSVSKNEANFSISCDSKTYSEGDLSMMADKFEGFIKNMTNLR